MLYNRVDSDVAKCDSAMIWDINIDEREYDYLYIYYKTQYSIQYSLYNKFKREDNS